MLMRSSGLVGTRAVGGLAEAGWREAADLCWLVTVSVKDNVYNHHIAFHRKCTHWTASRQRELEDVMSVKRFYSIYISEHRHYTLAHWKLEDSSNFQFFLEMGVTLLGVQVQIFTDFWECGHMSFKLKLLFHFIRTSEKLATCPSSPTWGKPLWRLTNRPSIIFIWFIHSDLLQNTI